MIHGFVHFFLSMRGAFVLGFLDATFFFTLPLWIDAVIVVLAARRGLFFWLTPLLATGGSLLGAALTYWTGQKIGEAMKWPTGLEKKPRAAAGFYVIIGVSTIAGVSLNLLHFDPIRALFWTAVVNGVVSAPLMLVIMLLAGRPSVMGHFTLPRRLQILGWSATAVMTAATIAFAVLRR